MPPSCRTAAPAGSDARSAWSSGPVPPAAAALDAGGAVADHPVEPLAQLGDAAPHPLLRQRVLVARLRGGEQVERVDPLVADQRLLQLHVAVGDVDQVVHDPTLGPHDEIEIAQADIEVDHHDVLPGLRQRGAEGSSRRRLSDASLAGCDYEDFRHVPVSLSVWSSAAILSSLPASQACTGFCRRWDSISSVTL